MKDGRRYEGVKEIGSRIRWERREDERGSEGGREQAEGGGERRQRGRLQDSYISSSLVCHLSQLQSFTVCPLDAHQGHHHTARAGHVTTQHG